MAGPSPDRAVRSNVLIAGTQLALVVQDGSEAKALLDRIIRYKVLAERITDPQALEGIKRLIDEQRSGDVCPRMSRNMRLTATLSRA